MSDEDGRDTFFFATRIPAPREAVYQAHTDTDLFGLWWGPEGVKTTVLDHEIELDGHMLYKMDGPAGPLMTGRFDYVDLEEPARIAFDEAFVNTKGKTVRHPGHPTWPMTVRTTLSLEADGDHATVVSLRAAPVDATSSERRSFREARGALTKGYAATYRRLTALLAATHPEPGPDDEAIGLEGAG
ncbi:SRPBCC family protein [Rubrivirga sp.]|uniref:SRPBCC family protein n=1 Tax=Rubrivirga sp. TaxID=1885344 RepID=UPI003C76E589